MNFEEKLKYFHLLGCEFPEDEKYEDCEEEIFTVLKLREDL